jgi:uncharacterized linocin/CFP29 family protein
MERALANSAAGLAGLIDPVTGKINVANRRPFLNAHGDSVVVANSEGDTVHSNAPALLQYEEWLDIDRVVIEVAVQRLVGFKDLMNAGLTHSMGSIGQTISLWDRSSDMTPAEVSMDGMSEGEEDTLAYQTASVPVPIIHKDFRLNLRRLSSSRIVGESLDITQASIAARLVAEKSEDMLFAGSTVVVDGKAIYGYMTFPDRNTLDINVAWTAPSKTGAQILADVQGMIAAQRADRFFGPYVLYVPATYEGILDNDYNPGTSDTRTIRARIMQLSGMQDIRVVDRLADANVLLVQLDRQVVDVAIAQDVSTLQWDENGGLQTKFKVMAVWVPRLKSDYDGRCGICHGSNT